jgi:nitroimidazol reductase NimA-like FMN-containing flavoprotein (pyridoxamine 5'-phosphate oxidase superfamily)
MEARQDGSMTRLPAFYELSEAECRALLARQGVGRLAFLAGARVDIEPLGYVLRGDWLFMRSAYGVKLEALERHPYVAFEVDEIRGPFDWESVVLHGTIYELPPNGTESDRMTFADAISALRTAMPEALTDQDPFPQRSIIYGLRIDTVSGRSANGAGAGREPLSGAMASRPPRRSDGF